MAVVITPLDPDSDHGREVADRLSQVLAEIRAEIEERHRAATVADEATAA